MENRWKLFGLVLFLIVISGILVSAAMDFESASNQIIRWIQEIFRPFFQVFLGDTFFLFERILFLFIILSFSYVALKRVTMFDDKPWALWVISVSVALLSTRYLTDTQIVQNILLSHGVLAITLTAGIPIVIFFFFAESFENAAVRKLVWLFFIVVFVGLWWSKSAELGQMSWIYMFTGVIALIFFLADGTIRRFMINSQIKQLGYTNRDEFIRKLRAQLYDLEEDYHKKNAVTPHMYRITKRRLEKELRQLLKQ